MPTLAIQVDEEQRLSRVLEVIEQQIGYLSKKRKKGSEELITYRKYMFEDAALFDRAEMVQNENIALTQEQAVMDVSLRLKRLRLLSSSPYFGRVDFREEGHAAVAPVYVGLHGLSGESGDLLIHDWRAPVSSMFYDYEVGPADYLAPDGLIKGDISLKRQYKIEQGRMLYMFDSSLTINDDILRDTLARNTTEKMRQIVNSIQKEQNAVIRGEDRKLLIVQGPAGSGKTSIAMHRAAYLLYRYRGNIAANNLLIFSPNEVFADYISNVLPELGEENIREATFEDYAKSILGKKIAFETRSDQMEFILGAARDAHYALRTASIEFKSSTTFLRILRRYARHLEHSNLRFQDIRLNDVLLLPGGEVEKLYREYCTEMPLVAGIERLKDRVLSRCLYSSEIAERKIEKEVEKVLVDRDALRLYGKLFNDPDLVRRLAEDDPLPANLSSICKLTRKSLRGKLPHEDVAPVLLLKRLVEGQPKYANIRHLIIDEAQDYSPVHFAIIRELFGGSSMTILGDLSQRINAHSGVESYDDLRDVFGRDAQSVVRLTRSYRSSWEISEFARGILPAADSADNVRRSGRRPVVVDAGSLDETARLVSGEIDKLKAEGMASIAVICKTAEEAVRVYSRLLPNHDVRLVESDSLTFHHGMVVLPVYLAKGLEFDAVIIHDASGTAYGAESERKLLYTACTRALHSLTVCFSGSPSPLLPLDRPELFDLCR